MLLGSIFITSVAQILLALFILQKNKKNLTNILFALLTLSTLTWALTNFATTLLIDSSNLIYVVRFILFFVVIQNAFFYLFAHTFPSPNWVKSKKRIYLYLGFTVVVALATLSPFVFTSVSVAEGIPTTVAGPAILLFIAHASYTIFSAFKTLIIKLRKSSGTVNNQLRLLLLASFLNWIIVPITNFALTPVLQTTFFISISPFYTLLFTAIIGYAIVAHKLFDVRLIVARSVAYIFSIGFLVVLYAGLSGLFISSLPDSLSSDYLSFSLNAFTFLVGIISYPRVKTFFDKLTNRFFFRDQYDPQEFLDELNKSIVRNIEIGILLRHSTAVIENNLHTSFCQVALRETSEVPTRVIGTKEADYSAKDLQIIKSELQQMVKRTIVTDELTDERRELKSVLSKHNIDVIVHLTESSYGNQQTIAFIIFGAKKSGNVYSRQDLKIIDIIADEMVIAIQNALRFEEIQEFNVTLQKKVNDATSKLRKTNEKLKSMDETKDEFISMASHQLRTPLTSVKGYLSMVLEGDAGEINENQRKLLDQAFVSSQRMVYLIADLLNVSRLRTGKFIIDAHPTNLAEVVESEVSQLIEQAKAKNQVLTFDKPTDFPLLTLDETKIRQVIMNFADNALFYTPSGGKIKIELTTDKHHVYFAVKDNGIGVPKEEQKHMFTKFYRAKNARNARPDGTGLGLFMAKKVITAQGGNILFQSSEGKGSTFGFSFNKKHLAVPENTETAQKQG